MLSPKPSGNIIKWRDSHAFLSYCTLGSLSVSGVSVLCCCIMWQSQLCWLFCTLIWRTPALDLYDSSGIDGFFMLNQTRNWHIYKLYSSCLKACMCVSLHECVHVCFRYRGQTFCPSSLSSFNNNTCHFSSLDDMVKIGKCKRNAKNKIWNSSRTESSPYSDV